MKIGEHTVEAIVFDLDGTLYDKKFLSARMILGNLTHLRRLRAIQSVRKRLMGVDLGSEEALLETFFATMSETYRFSRERIAQYYLSEFPKIFTNLLRRRYTQRPGLNPLLHRLQDKVIMSVYSDYGFVHQRLEALDIDTSLFSHLIAGREYGVFKPSARPLLDISEKMGLPPEHMLVVGDRQDTDGESARLAGMPFILIAKDGTEETRDPAKEQEPDISDSGTRQDVLTWNGFVDLVNRSI